MSHMHRKRRAVLPAIAAAGGSGLFLLINGASQAGAGGEASTIIGSLLITGAGAIALGRIGPRRRGSGRNRNAEYYPHLGSRKQLWVNAGATQAQLRQLDEIHRLSRLNPPVGYGDGRTVINPLSDAYAVFCSPAWRDSWLADRQLVIDPISEAGEIIGYVNRVTQMIREVIDKKNAAGPGSATRAQYGSYERALLESLNVVLRRARAFTHYRDEVRRLELILADQRSWPEAAALADRVMDVLAETARHDLATDYLDQSRVQLQMTENGMREITAILADTSMELRELPRSE